MDLTAFWIVPAAPKVKPGWIATGGPPIGLGVTAFDWDDARWMLHETGHARYLSAEHGEAVVHRDIQFANLPAEVQRHMGPIVVRGVWYPLWWPFTRRA